jgi:ribosomal protein S12 methylthiotransferase
MELPELVGALAELDGPHRLRIMYAYPNRFPWELTALLAQHPRVIPYLDIPIQHAATPVLRRMRRAGSGDQVREILDRLRREVPGITLRTTVLLGFPGETEADVAELIELIEEYGLARLGAFAYSPEEDTAGFSLPDPVPAAVAAERVQAVLAARDRALEATQRKLVGTEIEVLVDEAEGAPGPDGRGTRVGRGDMDAPEVDMIARVDDAAAAVGERIRVRVEELDPEFNLLCRAV